MSEGIIKNIKSGAKHGRNDKEENFYRAKELGEIPDDWLQEIRVPIKYDNFYHYNISYSVQNILY